MDSDVVRKLLQYELIDACVDCFGCSVENFGVLPQLKYQLKLTSEDDSKAVMLLGSSKLVELAKDFVSQCSEVSINIELINDLLDLSHPAIDSGEQTLFAALISNLDDHLFTGDKRALAALADNTANNPIENLWMRIFCFEEVILIISRTTAFCVVRDRIRNAPDVDTALKNAFGSSAPVSLDQVEAGLLSYVRDLVARTDQQYVLK